MALSRRAFIKNCLKGTAAAALGGIGFATNAFAGGVADRGGFHIGGARGPTRYIDLERSGELERRERALWDLYSPCRLCPRMCGANRAAGLPGICSAAGSFRIASAGPDFGNEAPIRGTRGSGGIFLSNCNLLCIFCQNWQIAHRGDGRQTTHAELADIMLGLQRRGLHNVSFITPSHLVPHLVSALRIAIAGGLTVPLCYNTSGYDSIEVMRLLDGVVDIYQPDFKFQDSAIAARFSHGAPGYTQHAAAAIKEMHRQVGGMLQMNGGIAYRGMVVRHLVMPENLGGADVFVRWVASELGTNTHVNIMGQYRPMFMANDFPPLDRRITQAEFNQALRWAREAGLTNLIN
jgi:putative pyruvate formate lyase activating enzyme